MITSEEAYDFLVAQRRVYAVRIFTCAPFMHAKYHFDGRQFSAFEYKLPEFDFIEGVVDAVGFNSMIILQQIKLLVLEVNGG